MTKDVDRALNLLLNGLLPQVHGAYHEALKMAIEALQMDQTWIPVFMKLPKEEEKPYWVCLDDGYQCECRWTNDMYGIGTTEWSEWGWHIMDKPQYSRVVAWKPLPESYKTKEGE